MITCVEMTATMAHRSITLLLLACLSFSTTFAQDSVEELTPDKKTDKTSDLKAVQVQQQVKPAFLIQPLVHRLQGRKGQLLKFEFLIEAHDRASRLEIRPVAMMQQENGVIMPDEKAPAPDLIRLTSAASVDLTAAEEHKIMAELRIPVTTAPFLSYGILVREIPLDDQKTDGPDDEARVGIRFVTQYLLRVDIDVIGVKGDSVSELKFPDATLVSQDGRCLARVFVENPTDTAMEFSLNCQLIKEPTQAVGKKFGLVVPVRAAQAAPERYKARILPNTRLRLEEYLPHPVFAGDYQLVAEVSNQGRFVRKMEYDISIHDGDFPAQDARIVRVAEDVTIEPTQIELSLRKGGRRMESISVKNGSLQKIMVQLSPEQLQGEFFKSLQLRPDRFELAPGQSRKVVVTVLADRDDSEHGYAYARLTVSPEVGEAIGTHKIPIALLTNSESKARLVPGDPQWVISNDRSGFTVPVQNDSLRHIPLGGRLSLSDEFGRGFVVESGFGRWLLPGQSGELFFGFREPPPPGTYELQVLLNQNEGEPPLQMTQTIRLQSPLEDIVPAPEKISSKPSDRK